VDQPPCAQDELLLGVALAMEHHPELVRDDGPVQREDSPIGHAFNAPGWPKQAVEVQRPGSPPVPRSHPSECAPRARLRARRSSFVTPNCCSATMDFSVFRFCFHFTSSSHSAHFFSWSSCASAQIQMSPFNTWLPTNDRVARHPSGTAKTRPGSARENRPAPRAGEAPFHAVVSGHRARVAAHALAPAARRIERLEFIQPEQHVQALP
jgi:hypothetical protein